ncbi:MAG: FHIPEP family type III secretion protein [Clostridia bacterium]
MSAPPSEICPRSREAGRPRALVPGRGRAHQGGPPGAGLLHLPGLLANGTLEILVLVPEAEASIRDGIGKGESGSYLNLNPESAQRLVKSLGEQLKRVPAGTKPAVLVSPLVRLCFKRLTERVSPELSVLNYTEMSPEIPVKTLGVVNL